MFNYVNVGVTANNFVPIPGGEGTLQGILITLFSAINNSAFPHDELIQISTDSVFIWRIFTFYMGAIVGLLTFLWEIISSSYRYKIKGGIANHKKGYKRVTIIIPYVSKQYQTINFFDWLIRNDYNDLDIDIIVYGATKKTQDRLSPSSSSFLLLF